MLKITESEVVEVMFWTYFRCRNELKLLAVDPYTGLIQFIKLQMQRYFVKSVHKIDGLWY